MAVDESYYPDPEESREDPGHQANTIRNFYHVNPTLFARLNLSFDFIIWRFSHFLSVQYGGNESLGYSDTNHT